MIFLKKLSTKLKLKFLKEFDWLNKENNTAARAAKLVQHALINPSVVLWNHGLSLILKIWIVVRTFVAI